MRVENQPVIGPDRIEVLDVLRGFALLGILLANSAAFSLYIFQSPPTKAGFPFPAVDRALDYFHLGFIDGKFYTIFSLLFGIGFSILFFREDGSTGRLSLFYRRLFFLLLIGICHVFLIWEGDILMFYAIVGTLLPLFRKMSVRNLMIIAVALILSPLVFDTVKIMTDGGFAPGTFFRNLTKRNDDMVGITDANFSNWVLVHDSYSQLRDWNRSGASYGWFLRLESNRIPKVLAMFLIGLAVGKMQFFSRIEEFMPMLRKIMIWCFAIGVPAGVAKIYFSQDNGYLPAPGGLLDTAAYALNVAPLGIGYAIAIALLYQKFKPKILIWLQPVGRMALTNYIAQSVISIGIYYGIGFGFGASFGPSGFMSIALLIFIAQVIYSRIWLHYFNYGPLEWIWRQLTYRKRLKLRRIAV